LALVALILTGLVALIHLYIVLLEMVWWDSPRGQKTFGMTPEFSHETKVLAANQGLYNGFLAAGLIWSLVHPDPAVAWQVQLFFLACVAVAGLFGAATVSRKILFIQTLPAVLAIIALVLR
jgi:Predicted membrane protein